MHRPFINSPLSCSICFFATNSLEKSDAAGVTALEPCQGSMVSLPGHRLPGCDTKSLPTTVSLSLPSILPWASYQRKSSSYHGPSRVVSLFGLAPSFLFHLTRASCQAVQLWPTVSHGHPRLFRLVSQKACLLSYLHTYLLTHCLPACLTSVFRPSVPACQPPFASPFFPTTRQSKQAACLRVSSGVEHAQGWILASASQACTFPSLTCWCARLFLRFVRMCDMEA